MRRLTARLIQYAFVWKTTPGELLPVFRQMYSAVFYLTLSGNGFPLHPVLRRLNENDRDATYRLLLKQPHYLGTRRCHDLSVKQVVLSR